MHHLKFHHFFKLFQSAKEFSLMILLHLARNRRNALGEIYPSVLGHTDTALRSQMSDRE